MGFDSSRISRNLLIVLLGTLVVIGVWFALTTLFRYVPGIALPLLLLTAIFLIVLVLIQRGKGGGLAGAFGGLGGQSAFGTKAGDLFTRITIGVALFWIVLCMATVSELGTPQSMLRQGMGESNPIRQGTSSSSDKGAGPSSQQTPAGGAAPSGSQDSGS